jgi:hypothetical protein
MEYMSQNLATEKLSNLECRGEVKVSSVSALWKLLKIVMDCRWRESRYVIIVDVALFNFYLAHLVVKMNSTVD